jgi:hypothetical protein
MCPAAYLAHQALATDFESGPGSHFHRFWRLMSGTDVQGRSKNPRKTSLLKVAYALMKSTIAAHLAPAALQMAATNSPSVWVAAAVVLAGIVLISAGFRFLWSEIPVFRYAIVVNVAIQLVAFALSLLMPQTKWPAGAGLVLAFLLCVVCLIHELNIAHEHNIPD